MSRRSELLKIGAKFGRLTITNTFYGAFPLMVEAVCECGRVKRYRWDNIRSGGSRACGYGPCKSSFRHGDTRGANTSSEYSSWVHMHSRCKTHPRYAGRGITVCDRWSKFENFLTDMGRKPSPLHTIERKNNDGNYEPSNCRWATRAEQMRNTSRSKKQHD